jgi:hypothetical protein
MLGLILLESHCPTANQSDDCSWIGVHGSCSSVQRLRLYDVQYDRGHRYILNLRSHESYTRYYHGLGNGPEYYIPNHGKDPESVNTRYRIRGNGVWTYEPSLSESVLPESVYQMTECKAIAPYGIIPSSPEQPGEIVFKIQGANVISSMSIQAVVFRATEADQIEMAVSTTNGLTWTKVWTHENLGEYTADVELVNEVNGAYEVLIRVRLLGSRKPDDACLKKIDFKTITMLNSKTQSKLLLGKNTVYVGAGDQTDSIVLWPDLQAGKNKPYIVEQRNITSGSKHPGYQGVMHAIRPNEDAYVIFRNDAPRHISRIGYGGRFYNRAPKSRIELWHSFDQGKNWTQSYCLTRADPPWDVIHYETVDSIPVHTESVWFKYVLKSPQAGKDACSIYTVHMEANHQPQSSSFQPMKVTFNWQEVQEDYSLHHRSHTQLVSKIPFRYTIHVGGHDHPVMDSLKINIKDAQSTSRYGYSDGKDVSG